MSKHITLNEYVIEITTTENLFYFYYIIVKIKRLIVTRMPEEG